jgi:hypothetical protein
MLYGSNIDVIDKGSFLIFLVQGQSSGNINSDYYMNFVKAVKNNDTGAYGIDYIEKAISGVGGSGTGGIDLGILNS